jgi:hypothetical protein
MPAMSFQDFRVGVDRRKSQQIVDQRGLYDCKNAFVNNGFAIKKRSGLDTILSTALTANSQGLFEFDEILYVVSHATAGNQTLSGYGVGGTYPISTTLKTLAVPNPDNGSDTVSRVWQFLVFNNQLYLVIEYASGTIRHHYGTAAQLIAGTNVAITDTNCPNGKSAVVHDSKIYALQPETNNPAYVKYSATEDPTNWSKVKDASGLLGIPAGLEAMGNEHAVAVTSYRGFLAVFMQNSIQLWKTHPNPGLIELDTTVDNAFIEYFNSMAPINEDIFYLNSSGIHSIGQKLYTDTMATSDIGSPISDLVRSALSTYSTSEPKAVYFPGENQYILVIGKEMFVFTHSKSVELKAWTRYTIPDTVLDIVPYRNYLFLRGVQTSGDEFVYSFNPSSYQDVLDTTTTSIPVEVLSSYNSLGQAGTWKQIYGSDVIFEGTATLQHRWDSRSPAEETTAFELTDDTRPGVLIPVELMTTEISYKITQSDNSDFQLNGLTYYYNQLGLF